MKTLSIQQPWASLLAEGVKPIELRGWSTSYRGQILIRASKSIMPWTGDADKRMKLPTNCLLFVGELVGVHSMRYDDAVGAMSFFSNDEFAWIIQPQYYVYPTPAAGKLKLYETDAALITRLPDGEVRQHHPELKRRTTHPYRAAQVKGGLVVTDSRSGEEEYVNVHRSNTQPFAAWVFVPLFGYIGGAQGGNTPVSWKELAAAVNLGNVYQSDEELPFRDSP